MLRASQVETLRAVAGYPRPITPAELGGLIGPHGGLTVRAARERLEGLREARLLCAHLKLLPKRPGAPWPQYKRHAFSLTQLGREALESQQ